MSKCFKVKTIDLKLQNVVAGRLTLIPSHGSRLEIEMDGKVSTTRHSISGYAIYQRRGECFSRIFTQQHQEES